MSAAFPDWWLYTSISLAGAGVLVAFLRGFIARSQEKTTKQGVLDERFKMGVDLLDRGNMAVRVGGVHVLVDMAKLYPEYNHVRVMEIFVSFLSYPPVKQGGHDDGKVNFQSADIIAITKYVDGRDKRLLKIEREASFSLEERLSNSVLEIRNGKLVPRKLRTTLEALGPRGAQAPPAVPRPRHG